MKIKLFFASFILLLTSITANALPISGTDVPELSELDTIMTNWMNEYGFEAVTLAVMKNRHLVYEKGYGYQDAARTQTILPNAKMRLATNSVNFTRRALQVLVDEGVLARDDKVYDVVGLEPWGGGEPTDPRVRQLTIGNLLDEKSCVIDGAKGVIEQGQIMDLGRNATIAESIQYLWAQTDSFRTDCQIGEDQIFSHHAYELAALVIAIAADPAIDLADHNSVGRVYGDYVQQKIGEPLDAVYLQAENHAYLAHENEIWYESKYLCEPDWNLYWESGYELDSCAYTIDFFARPGSGTIVTSARDMARYLQKYYVTADAKPLNLTGVEYNRGGGGSLSGTTTIFNDRVYTDSGDSISFVYLVNERDEPGLQTPSDHALTNAIKTYLYDNVTDWPMIDLFEDNSCYEYGSTNQTHVDNGRAYTETEQTGCIWGSWGCTTTTTYFAVGSNENLGTNGSSSSLLNESSVGYFAQGNCPVPDTTAPIITLNGDNPLSISLGSNYVDPGYSANDDRDGDVSGQVLISGNVDTTTAGTYYKYYDVTDAVGNVAEQKTRTVIVEPDTTAPVITLTGSNPLTVYRDGAFLDPGYSALDDVDGDITSDVIVTGTIDTSVIGSYELSYNVIDAAGNSAVEVIRTIEVIEAPQCVEYSATAAAHVSAGRAYSEDVQTGCIWGNFGCTTTTTYYAVGSADDLGTNSSATVILNEDPEGYYSLGSCPGPDITAPVITLIGANPMTVNFGGTYAEPGANADDNVDGDISNQVEITGNVDTSTVGTYYLDYKVSDAAGNISPTVTRTVNVVEGGICITAVNSDHVASGRAYEQYGILVYAQGSDVYLGTTTTSTSLEEEAPGNWIKVDSCY